MKAKQQLYIGGAWVAGEGAALQRRDPVRDALVWEGFAASDAQVAQAVEAARGAFPDWSRKDPEARLRIVKLFQGLLKDRKDTLAAALAEETGKPLWEAKTEIDAMVGKVDLSWQSYQQRTGYSTQEVAAGQAVLRHRPHGVMAVFGPYNFPGHLPNGHIVPALLAGNTVIFKPSELTPRLADLVVQLWAEAGVPAGVMNLVQGAADTGRALAQPEWLDGLLFTGSSTTGAILHRAFAGYPGKILALEMGGNNPLILAEPFDPRACLHHVLFSAFVSAGQRCTCARRLFVPEGATGDKHIQWLVQAASTLKQDAWDADPQPFMGSLITAAAAQHVVDAAEALAGAGGQVLLQPEIRKAGTGLVSPGIVDISDCSEVPDEEVFGPLLRVIRYRDFDTALEQANATQYGLAAGLICDDKSRFEAFSARIRAGVVNWNKPLTGASSAAPFGGVGASGNHRPSAFYAADYCAWPMASLVADRAEPPATLPAGMALPG